MRLKSVWLTLFCTLPLLAKGGRALAEMEPAARETAIAAMKWNDVYWDDSAAFLWNTSATPVSARTEASRSRRHLVRETSWYALGLLMRNAEGDRDRAIRAIEAVLRNQIDEPSQPYQ